MALNNLGMVRPGTTLVIPFPTFDSNDPSKSVTVTELDVGAITVFKDGGLTQRASTSGEGVDIDVDAIVGTHWITIDLADNGTAGFYAAGSRYVVILQGLVIDGATAMSAPVATFEIGYQNAILNTTVASVTSQTQFILTVGPAEADVLIGCKLLFHDVASAVQLAYAYVTDYAVTTKEITCTDPVGFTFVATDNVSVFMPDNVHAVQGTTQTAGDISALVTTADAAIDVAVADLANGTDGLSALKTLIDALNDAPAVTAAAIVNEWESQSQADPTGFHVNVLEVAGTAQTAGDVTALVVTADAAIDVAVADLANGTDGLGALKALIDTVDTVADAIKVVTDKFAFTVANQVDSNALQIEGADATDTINAAVDAALDTAIAELSQGVPTATPTVRTALMLMYMAMRNKLDVPTSGTDTLEIHNDAGTRIAQKLLTDDGSDYSEAKMTSGA